MTCVNRSIHLRLQMFQCTNPFLGCCGKSSKLKRCQSCSQYCNVVLSSSTAQRGYTETTKQTNKKVLERREKMLKLHGSTKTLQEDIFYHSVSQFGAIYALISYKCLVVTQGATNKEKHHIDSSLFLMLLNPRGSIFETVNMVDQQW